MNPNEDTMSEGEYYSRDHEGDELAIEEKVSSLQSIYLKNKRAAVRSRIECICGTPFTKKVYQQAFCCTRCKDQYWNTVDENRRNRVILFSKP